MRRTYSVLFSGFVAEEARGPLLVSESHTEAAVLHAAFHPFHHHQVDRVGSLDGQRTGEDRPDTVDRPYVGAIA